MHWRQRVVLPLLAAVVGCAPFSVRESSAQTYPVKPIRLLVGFSPGGSADVTARLVAQKLTALLGQPLVIENRPGAAGAIANERVAASPADGYTLLAMGTSATVLPSLRAKLPYNVERDLAPVSLVALTPFVLVVHPSVPARDAKELIALARSQPGKLNFGSVGVGSPPFLMGELFKDMAKVNIVHVPFKGGAENVTATAAGHIDMSFASVPSIRPLLDAGRIRALAATTAKRASAMPDLPTLHESGLPGYDRSSWQGVLVPAGVPREIVARLNAAIVHVVQGPDLKEAFKKEGLEPQTTTPEEFAARISDEIAKNAKLLRQIGFKPE
jgi:tripartite-type tricarboxylate transporter receptor subunit TctC